MRQRWRLIISIMALQRDDTGPSVEDVAFDLGEPVADVARWVQRLASPQYDDGHPWLRPLSCTAGLMVTNRAREAIEEGKIAPGMSVEGERAFVERERQGYRIDKDGRFEPSLRTRVATPTGSSKQPGRKRREGNEGGVAFVARRLGVSVDDAAKILRDRGVRACPDCRNAGRQEFKPLSEFSPDNRICKECKRLRERERRANRSQSQPRASSSDSSPATAPPSSLSDE